MFEVGQDVIVTFDGEDYSGEIIDITRGWIMARVDVDPLADHGDLTPLLSPRSIVNVRESAVRTLEDANG